MDRTTLALAWDSPVVAEFGLRATLLLADDAVTGQRDIAPDPAVQEGTVRLRGGHDLLTGQGVVGGPDAELICADPAALAERALQDGLGAHAAVRGLVEQVRVAPAMLALAEEVLQLHLPLRSLETAPQGKENRKQHGEAGPEQQGPVLPRLLHGQRWPKQGAVLLKQNKRNRIEKIL